MADRLGTLLLVLGFLLVEASASPALLASTISGPTPRAEDSLSRTSPAESRFQEGLQFALRHDLPEAVSAFRAAIALDPDNPFFHYNLGVVYGMQHRLVEAVAELRLTLTLRPTFQPAHFRLALIFEMLDRYDEAAAQYDVVLQGDRSTWEYHTAVERLGQITEVRRRHPPHGIGSAGD